MNDFATLCVLSFERPDSLARTIDSAVAGAQGLPLEVIVHDDGSTNMTVRDYLVEAVEEGKVSRVILNPPGWNEGQGTACNRMFSMARGDVIIKSDQDLEFQPGWLHTTRRLLKVPCIGLLGLMHYHHEPVDSKHTLIKQHEAWSERTHILGSAFAMSRYAWETFTPFTEHSSAFSEDWEMQRRVFEHPGAWCCALPIDDLAVNLGMGIGPSTVVLAGGQVQPIKDGPWLVQGPWKARR